MAELAALGVSSAVIARQHAPRAADDQVFWVYDGNAEAVRWYLEHPFIWRDGFSGRAGLDYTQIDAALRLERHPTRSRADLFQRLRAIEDGYMNELMRKA